MAKKKIIKINSNPNKTPASGIRNPTLNAEGDYDYYWNVVADKYGHKEQPKEIKKINSNPVKGKTVIGPLARGAGQGGIAGLALGAIAAYKQELADLARRKREIS